MQIVRDLAGYTLGRSDLVRRAMAKKKAAVMEKERQNLCMAMKKKVFLDVFHAELMRKRQIIYMMR